MSQARFAALLSDLGVPCTREGVENANKKKTFTPHQCPPTPEVQAALRSLKVAFPHLRTELFLPVLWNEPLLPLEGEPCVFIEKLRSYSYAASD